MGYRDRFLSLLFSWMAFSFPSGRESPLLFLVQIDLSFIKAPWLLPPFDLFCAPIFATPPPLPQQLLQEIGVCPPRCGRPPGFFFSLPDLIALPPPSSQIFSGLMHLWCLCAISNFFFCLFRPNPIPLAPPSFVLYVTSRYAFDRRVSSKNGTK